MCAKKNFYRTGFYRVGSALILVATTAIPIWVTSHQFGITMAGAVVALAISESVSILMAYLTKYRPKQGNKDDKYK